MAQGRSVEVGLEWVGWMIDARTCMHCSSARSVELSGCGLVEQDSPQHTFPGPTHNDDNKQLLKFMLVNGQKSSIERERHGQSFLRFGNTEVGEPVYADRPRPRPSAIRSHRSIFMCWNLCRRSARAWASTTAWSATSSSWTGRAARAGGAY